MQAVLSSLTRAREEAAQRDMERLQGGWRFVAGPRYATLIIQGDQYLMRFRNGDQYEGSLSLDPCCRPRAMDMTITDGPEHHRGKRVLAIYQFDGDHLIWSPGVPGEAVRPEAFPPLDGSALCLIFRRAT
ncbi:MAG: TIGR03067 domain-containing protein [Gemmataceae bacterium]